MTGFLNVLENRRGVVMLGFVIQYNRRTGKVQYAQFPDLRTATQKRIELEEERTDGDIEIISVMGDSLAEIESTHSRYFASDRGTLLT